MVTKPKRGAVKGRPKKPQPPKQLKPPKRDRGRPAKRLAQNPNRYLLALVQGIMYHQKATGAPATDQKIAEGIVALSHGARPIDKEGNLAALMRGEWFEVGVYPEDIKHRGGVPGESWRDKNYFIAVAGDMQGGRCCAG
jgi:hypothetical protein